MQKWLQGRISQFLISSKSKASVLWIF